MQTERTKKSMFLFEEELQPEEIESLIAEDQQLLKKLLAHCGKVYQKQMKKSYPVSTFLRNYKWLMKTHSSTVANVLSVNICIHFALLCSQSMLKENRESEAKGLLRQATEYSEIEGTDAMLLGVSFNNLAYLHYKQGKLYKALNVGLQAIYLIQSHLQISRASSVPKQRFAEDVVVFVSVVSIVHKTLSRILKKRDKEEFRVLFKNVNRLGYVYSVKYLGRDSMFTKRFYLPQVSIILPVYEQLDYSQVQQFRPNDFQLKLADELHNIYQKLSEMNLEPEVIYIRENLVQSRESLVSSIIAVEIPEEVPEVVVAEPEPQYQVHYCNKFIVNNEEMSISILRDFNEFALEGHSYTDFLGHIEFKTMQNSLEIVQRIHQEKFQKILNCLTIRDFLPYQLQVDKMNSSEFCRRILVNFVKVVRVAGRSKIQIFPRSIGLLDPFSAHFCGENVLIFVNHVCFSKFRIAICPPSACDTLYLNLYLNQKETYLTLIQVQNEKIRKIGSKYNEYNQANLQHFSGIKKVNAFQQRQFQAKIQQVLAQFEAFLQQMESQMTTNFTQLCNLGDQQPFYLCSEQKQNKKTFLQLRYRSNVNHIEVYLKNTYKTYTPTGLSQAKGSSIYSPDNFLKDFLFGLKNARINLSPFLNIIAQKFTLKTFNQPMEEHEQDRFQQNAIQEIQLNSKFFKRKFIEFEDYKLPVTLELITIKNQKPIGIRVSAYEPIKCVQTGVFIYLIPEYWQNYYKEPPAQIKDTKTIELQNLDKSNTNLFDFQKKYFLTSWLKEEGFDLIFSKIVIVNRTLELKGINRKYCSLEELI